MSIQAQTTSTYALPPVLDFAAAEGFQASLIEKLQASPTLNLDASAVETLTTPCVQLILAAAKSHHLTIANPSVAFNSAFSDLGLNWEDYAEASGDSAVAQSAAQIAEVMQAVESAPIEATASETPDIADSEQPNGSAMAKRILTIDDSKTMRDMLMLTLADAGFDVIQAIDGKEGVDLLERENVDVVITDINMPRMDGYEVVRQLRARPEHKTTPILVLTIESEAEKKNIAREAGA